MSKPTYQQISVASIEQSSEIQNWLSQFSDGQQATAKTLLSRLKFVSRDEYSRWLHRSIEQLPSSKTYALYSVRKLDSNEEDYWEDSGAPKVRPATSQGSEDMVYSIISNLVRSQSENLLDHPSIPDLKSNRIRDFVLIDDSIGSGDRISGFLNAMLENPTILSWWSLGWIRIKIISFARPKASERRIIGKIRGSDHGKRKFRKSSKVDFISELVYDEKWLKQRWGSNYQQIVELCRNKTKVAKWARLGYGGILSNVVFYHSVPNNIPGILWFSNSKWNGLLNGRVLPSWLIDLLNNNKVEKTSPSSATPISNDLFSLLSMVKRGVRRTSSIAIRLNVDHHYARKLTEHAERLGLLTPKFRLTKAGLDRLKQHYEFMDVPNWDYSLYIPSSWCAGQANIQPSIGQVSSPVSSTDSVGASTPADGGVGEASLERSDAKAAAPPFSVMSQSPSSSRESHDTDGPPGSKER
ncbi:hypothetical protein [Microbulbifer halophilus]|uniref:Uncharacterized protein n=1 Tax=Microbulbifer halophilus TaxID=453963 RepID=A0ABW5EG10_9GAMM|nr:hypothetical protein [Microbulbifer halophilus]MCW8128688.1 hypothetical protein [Microbulbifer halophilus]